jgi:polyhydroxyalkanoate synthesis regulator phasin
MDKENEPLMTAPGGSNSEIDALRLRIESVEAERSAFFQEGVFDLIKNILKDSGVNRTCEIERLKEQVAQLQHMVEERDEQLRRVRERVSENLDDGIR